MNLHDFRMIFRIYAHAETPTTFSATLLEFFENDVCDKKIKIQRGAINKCLLTVA
jgi:hypothetical protein